MIFKQIVAICAMTLMLIACAQPQVETSEACSAGSTCTLIGRAVVYPPADGEQSWLEAKDRCFALALPDRVYANRERWNGRNVKIVGTAYRQPEGTLLYYEIKGRRISAGVCPGQPLIIVDVIDFAD